MKSFGSFIKEAVETSASRQAKLMNLIGDGHGDWYDKEGNLIAKTVKGRLHFFGGGAKTPEAQEPEQGPGQQQARVMQRQPLERQADKASTGVVIVIYLSPSWR